MPMGYIGIVLIVGELSGNGVVSSLVIIFIVCFRTSMSDCVEECSKGDIDDVGMEVCMGMPCMVWIVCMPGRLVYGELTCVLWVIICRGEFLGISTS